ncbi:DUF4136 domain-containing protein [Algoriphagus namhaensis]
MKLKQLLFSFLALMAFACSPTSQLSDQYTSFNLSDYQKYTFYEVDGPENPPADYQENVKFLQEEISKALKEKGLTEGSGPGSLKINLGIVVEDKVQTRETSLTTDPFMYTGQRSYTWQTEEVPVNTYKEGTLTMHLVDNQSNEVVWAGTASRVIPKKTEKKQRAASDAVADLFEQIEN